MKRYLPFDSIIDLDRKVSEIKKEYKEQTDLFKSELKEKGIEFTPVNEYGVIVDFEDLSTDDLKIFLNQEYLTGKLLERFGVVRENVINK